MTDKDHASTQPPKKRRWWQFGKKKDAVAAPSTAPLVAEESAANAVEQAEVTPTLSEDGATVDGREQAAALNTTNLFDLPDSDAPETTDESGTFTAEAFSNDLVAQTADADPDADASADWAAELNKGSRAIDLSMLEIDEGIVIGSDGEVLESHATYHIPSMEDFASSVFGDSDEIGFTSEYASTEAEETATETDDSAVADEDETAEAELLEVADTEDLVEAEAVAEEDEAVEAEAVAEEDEAVEAELETESTLESEHVAELEALSDELAEEAEATGDQDLADEALAVEAEAEAEEDAVAAIDVAAEAEYDLYAPVSDDSDSESESAFGATTVFGMAETAEVEAEGEFLDEDEIIAHSELGEALEQEALTEAEPVIDEEEDFDRTESLVWESVVPSPEVEAEAIAAEDHWLDAIQSENPDASEASEEASHEEALDEPMEWETILPSDQVDDEANEAEARWLTKVTAEGMEDTHVPASDDLYESSDAPVAATPTVEAPADEVDIEVVKGEVRSSVRSMMREWASRLGFTINTPEEAAPASKASLEETVDAHVDATIADALASDEPAQELAESLEATEDAIDEAAQDEAEEFAAELLAENPDLDPVVLEEQIDEVTDVISEATDAVILESVEDALTDGASVEDDLIEADTLVSEGGDSVEEDVIADETEEVASEAEIADEAEISPFDAVEETVSDEIETLAIESEAEVAEEEATDNEAEANLDTDLSIDEDVEELLDEESDEVLADEESGEVLADEVLADEIVAEVTPDSDVVEDEIEALDESDAPISEHDDDDDEFSFDAALIAAIAAEEAVAERLLGDEPQADSIEVVEVLEETSEESADYAEETETAFAVEESFVVVAEEAVADETEVEGIAFEGVGHEGDSFATADFGTPDLDVASPFAALHEAGVSELILHEPLGAGVEAQMDLEVFEAVIDRIERGENPDGSVEDGAVQQRTLAAFLEAQAMDDSDLLAAIRNNPEPSQVDEFEFELDAPAPEGMPIAFDAPAPGDADAPIDAPPPVDPTGDDLAYLGMIGTVLPRGQHPLADAPLPTGEPISGANVPTLPMGAPIPAPPVMGAPIAAPPPMGAPIAAPPPTGAPIIPAPVIVEAPAVIPPPPSAAMPVVEVVEEVIEPSAPMDAADEFTFAFGDSNDDESMLSGEFGVTAAPESVATDGFAAPPPMGAPIAAPPPTGAPIIPAPAIVEAPAVIPPPPSAGAPAPRPMPAPPMGAPIAAPPPTGAPIAAPPPAGPRTIRPGVAPIAAENKPTVTDSGLYTPPTVEERLGKKLPKSFDDFDRLSRVRYEPTSQGPQHGMFGVAPGDAQQAAPQRSAYLAEDVRDSERLSLRKRAWAEQRHGTAPKLPSRKEESKPRYNKWSTGDVTEPLTPLTLSAIASLLVTGFLAAGNPLGADGWDFVFMLSLLLAGPAAIMAVTGLAVHRDRLFGRLAAIGLSVVVLFGAAVGMSQTDETTEPATSTATVTVTVVDSAPATAPEAVTPAPVDSATPAPTPSS